ncbi:class I SAM-dependent methyltransferase [Arthrobacter sp. R1-13]
MSSRPNPAEHWRTVDAYYSTLGLPDELLQWMCVGRDKKTATLDRYITGIPECSILEIGTFIGVSAAGMALSNTTSRVCTVDPNYPVTVLGRKWGVESTRGSLDFARAAFSELGVQNRVTVLEGFFSGATSTYMDRYVNEWGGGNDIGWERPPVLTSEVRSRGPFDVIFVDGDHSMEAVFNDLKLAAECLGDNGTLLLDDVVGHCGGAVCSAVKRFQQDQRELGAVEYSFCVENDIGVMRRL